MAQELKTTHRLSDTVARQLEQRILEGALKAGDRLPAERDFSLELGVSRPCLREAIQKLEADKAIGEDEKFRMQEDLDKKVKEWNIKIEQTATAKEEEIMTI